MKHKYATDQADKEGTGAALAFEDIKRRIAEGEGNDGGRDEDYEAPFAPEIGDDLFRRATLPALQQRQAAIARQDGRKNRRPNLAQKIFKDRKFINYFEAMGYKNPIECLIGVANADVAELAKMLQCPRERAFGYILRAAETLAPYWAAKAPTDLHVQNQSLGFFYNAGRLRDQPAANDGERPAATGEISRTISVQAIEQKEE